MNAYLPSLLCYACIMWGCTTKTQSPGSSDHHGEIVNIAMKIAEQENLLPTSYTTAVRKDASDGSWVVIFYKMPRAHDSFIMVVFRPEVEYEVLTAQGVEIHKGRLRVEYRNNWIATEKGTETEKRRDEKGDIAH